MSEMRMLVQGLSESERQQIITQVLEARAKRGEFLVAMKQRQQQGWHVAQHCALILKEKFGVKRVVLFGSMLDYESMSWHSDIDLAVEGLAASDLWKAGAALEKGHDFSIDLVELELAKPHIIKAIAQGVDL